MDFGTPGLSEGQVTPATTGTERIEGVTNPGSTFGRGAAFHCTIAVGGGEVAFHHPTKPLASTVRVP